jgi:hypothetical protein
MFTVSEHWILLTRISTLHIMNKQSIWKLHSSLLLHPKVAQWNRPTLALCKLFNVSFKWNFIRLLHQKFETGQFQCSLHQSRPFLFSSWNEGEIREGWKRSSQFKSSVLCGYQVLTNWKVLRPLEKLSSLKFRELLSGVPALLNAFRRKGRAKRPKEKDYKMAISSVGTYPLKISSRLFLFHGEEHNFFYFSFHFPVLISV